MHRSIDHLSFFVLTRKIKYIKTVLVFFQASYHLMITLYFVLKIIVEMFEVTLEKNSVKKFVWKREFPLT